MKMVKYDVAYLEEDDSIVHAYAETPWTGTETTEFLAKAKKTGINETRGPFKGRHIPWHRVASVKWEVVNA